VTDVQFIDWLRDAETGDRLAYHTGFFAVDRGDAKAGKLTATHRRIRALGDAVVRAAEAGDVALTQRRLAVGRWEYVATRLAS
jgi:hypothetical protein